MADIDPNFSCSDPALLRGNVTERVWMVLSEGPAHENSILAIAAFQILFVVLGIPWNSIVFIAILKKRLYNQPTYLLLLNLIVSDLLVCVCVMPFNIASAIAKEFTIGDSDYARCQVCHTIVIIITTLIYVSLFSLAFMSIDRLIYIRLPVRYSSVITVKRVIVVMVTTWLFCILISIPPVFGFGEIKFANLLSACSIIVVGENRLTSHINYMVFLALVGIIPFMATLVTNIWLLILTCKTVNGTFNKHIDIAQSRCHSTLERKENKNEIKTEFRGKQFHLAYVFGAIFAANIITWIPSLLIALASAIVGSANIPSPPFAFQYIVFLSQPAIHPILETCLLGKAKNMVTKCICCCNKRKRGADSTNNATQLRKISNISTSVVSSP